MIKISEEPKIIIISGMTCSGKTTLANEIKEIIFHDKSVIVPQDTYYKNLVNIPKIKGMTLLDSINAFEINEYLNDINNLINEGYLNIPVYDIENNKRISKDERVDKKEILVLEGLHTLSIFKNYLNALRIYLDIDIEICLQRRIERDKKYGISEDAIRKYFYEILIPMYELYIKPQKELANFIVREGGDKECLLKKLVNY